MPEYPVAHIIFLVEPAVIVVEAIDADVMQQATGAHQVRVDPAVSSDQESLCNAPYDFAVHIHEFERLTCRCVLFMQFTDFSP